MLNTQPKVPWIVGFLRCFSFPWVWLSWKLVLLQDGASLWTHLSEGNDRVSDSLCWEQSFCQLRYKHLYHSNRKWTCPYIHHFVPFSVHSLGVRHKYWLARVKRLNVVSIVIHLLLFMGFNDRFFDVTLGSQ